MEKDIFKQRERALEDEFFHRVDRQLLADLKNRLATEQECGRLAAATGLTDPTLLKELVQAGVSAEAFAAISLAPMILVAWADRKVKEQERRTIIQAAHEQGIPDDSPAGHLLSYWLSARPDGKLETAWNHYAQAVSAKLSDEARQVLRRDVVRRARLVAKATGGALGLGAISDRERQVIENLERAFDQ